MDPRVGQYKNAMGALRPGRMLAYEALLAYAGWGPGSSAVAGELPVA
jgi:hypothetical protein